MGKSLTRKIIESHFVSGDMTPGKEIFIKVDQTLTHDINAVMTYLACHGRTWFKTRQCAGTSSDRSLPEACSRICPHDFAEAPEYTVGRREPGKARKSD